jgi:DNA-binding transcriptional LysR family regulator
MPSNGRGRAVFNLRSVDLNLLTVFEAIYEVGTVTSAADRLALSQSATSHALTRLREMCGDELFVRTSKGVTPTPVAQALYPVVSKALVELRKSLAEAAGFDPTQSERRFRISIPHPMGPFYALRLRAALAAVAPGVALTFETTSRPTNLEDHLRDGVVDIAIDWVPVELDPFVNRKLFDDQLVLVARADHPSVKGHATLEDLRKLEFVLPHIRREVDRLPAPLRDFQNLGLPEALRVSELLEIPAVVWATDLVGIFPASMASAIGERLGLQVLAPPFEVPLPIYAIWHEGRRNDAAHRWLRALVAAEVNRSVNAGSQDHSVEAVLIR